jgi:hypothetical protein
LQSIPLSAESPAEYAHLLSRLSAQRWSCAMKEEQQSINEELQTVNSELKLKLDTLSRAHSNCRI